MMLLLNRFVSRTNSWCEPARLAKKNPNPRLASPHVPELWSQAKPAMKTGGSLSGAPVADILNITLSRLLNGIRKSVGEMGRRRHSATAVSILNERQTVSLSLE